MSYLTAELTRQYLDRLTWHTPDQQKRVGKIQVAIRNFAQAGPETAKLLEPRLMKWLSDYRLLRYAWNELARAGKAPGPNDWRYEDFENHEVQKLLGFVGDQVKNRSAEYKSLCASFQSMSAEEQEDARLMNWKFYKWGDQFNKGPYRPGPSRKLTIQKSIARPKLGHRTIRIVNIQDQVLQRAILLLVEPMRDHLLSPNVFGFRSGRDRLHALARAEFYARTENRLYWVSDDVRNAFDNVRLNPLRQLLYKRLHSRELVDLIIDLVRASPTAKIGTKQGGSLSPFTLNQTLDHFVVKPFSKEFWATPQLWYADDLLIPCVNRNEAVESWQATQRLLKKAGMEGKAPDAESAIHQLGSGESLTWLGFQVSFFKKRLVLRVADRSWETLREHLCLAHYETDAPPRAQAILHGWVTQLGPVYTSRDPDGVINRALETARDEGFDEVPTKKALRASWWQGWNRWMTIRNGALQGHIPSSTVVIPTKQTVDLLSSPDPDQIPFVPDADW